MCPGLTHKNVVEELAAKPVPDNTPVAILAEVGARSRLTWRLRGMRAPTQLAGPSAAAARCPCVASCA